MWKVPNDTSEMDTDNVDVHPAFQKTQEHDIKEDEICDPVSLMSETQQLSNFFSAGFILNSTTLAMTNEVPSIETKFHAYSHSFLINRGK